MSRIQQLEALLASSTPNFGTALLPQQPPSSIHHINHNHNHNPYQSHNQNQESPHHSLFDSTGSLGLQVMRPSPELDLDPNNDKYSSSNNHSDHSPLEVDQVIIHPKIERDNLNSNWTHFNSTVFENSPIMDANHRSSSSTSSTGNRGSGSGSGSMEGLNDDSSGRYHKDNHHRVGRMRENSEMELQMSMSGMDLDSVFNGRRDETMDPTTLQPLGWTLN